MCFLSIFERFECVYATPTNVTSKWHEITAGEVELI